MCFKILLYHMVFEWGSITGPDYLYDFTTEINFLIKVKYIIKKLIVWTQWKKNPNLILNLTKP